jgi:hypothetical protein
MVELIGPRHTQSESAYDLQLSNRHRDSGSLLQQGLSAGDGNGCRCGGGCRGCGGGDGCVDNLLRLAWLVGGDFDKPPTLLCEEVTELIQISGKVKKKSITDSKRTEN